MGRGRADDEATRVDASVLRHHRDEAPESFDEPTALMRRGKGPAFPPEVTIRTRPVSEASEDTTAVPRATVAGRLDRGDEAPPLPFEAKIGSVPPPPAVDLYEGGDLDPLNVTGKLKKVGGAALPFDGQAGGAAPPAVVGPDDRAQVMGDTSTMLQKVHEAALPFDAPQPKYPPRQLVPLEQNPLYARGAASVTMSSGATSGTSRRLVVVAVVLVAVIAVALLLARTT